MSSSDDTSPGIMTYEDLLQEKARLEVLIQNQKNIVRHDVDELRAEFRKEIKPVVDTAKFFKKVIVPSTRNQSLVNAGANAAIDIALTAFLGKSSFLVRAILPRIVKTYTSNFLQRFNWKRKVGTR
jgi:hypothetical protein